MFSFNKPNFSNSDTVLKAVLEQANPDLIDVRSAEEFAAGSVKGARNIPLPELPERLNELDKTKPTILFCLSGNRSGQAVQFLQNNGFDLLHNGGGWRALAALVDEL